MCRTKLKWVNESKECFVSEINKIITHMNYIENKEKFCRIIPYGVLLYNGIIPSVTYMRYQESSCSKAFMGILALFSFLGIFYATMCIFKTGFVKKGVISVNIPEEIEKKCNFCNETKPERAHHCKICKKCVLKMDHHCNILAVCINHFNHGHFIRFILFTWLSSFTLFLYNAVFIITKCISNKNKVTYGMSTSVMFSTLIPILTLVVTSMHLKWQIENLFQNVTNVELVQVHNSKYRGVNCGTSPYNFGFRSNVVDVLGPGKYLYLGPTQLDGYNWKKLYKTFYWPLIDFETIQKLENEDI